MSERHRRDPQTARWNRNPALGEHLDRLFPEDQTVAPARDPAMYGSDGSPGERQAAEHRAGLPSLVVVAALAALLLAAGIGASAALFWNDTVGLPSGSAGGARAQVSTASGATDLRGLGRLLIEPGESAARQAQPKGAPLPDDTPLPIVPKPPVQRLPAPPAAEAVATEPEGKSVPADRAGVDGDAPLQEVPGVTGEGAADRKAAGEDEAARFDRTVRPVIEDLLASPPAAVPGEPAPQAPTEAQSRDNDYPDSPPPSSPPRAAPGTFSNSRPPPPREPALTRLESAEPGVAVPRARARVFVHYSTRAERGRDAAAATARHLEAAGYQVADIRTVGFDVASARVRYFFDGDRAAAQRLTADLRTYLVSTALGHPSVDLQSYTTFKPLPAPGNIEVWIPSAGAP